MIERGIVKRWVWLPDTIDRAHFKETFEISFPGSTVEYTSDLTHLDSRAGQVNVYFIVPEEWIKGFELFISGYLEVYKSADQPAA